MRTTFMLLSALGLLLGCVSLPAKQPHFVHTASHVVVEVQSTGPFVVTYVNPKDDPRAGSTP
jgi:hypothetical protein